MKDNRTILLVDDSEDDHLLMREAFEMADCHVPLQSLYNGEEALAYLGGSGSYTDREKFPLPIVMLLDLNMPKMNGFGVLEWVRAQPFLKRLAIVVFSASMRLEDVERAFDLGATSFLVKPSGLDALAEMVGSLCSWIEINHFPSLNSSGKKDRFLK